MSLKLFRNISDRFSFALLLVFISFTNSFSQSGIYSSGFIFDQAPFKACHASTIAETNKGLVVAWFGGTHEKNKDVEIWASRKTGETWSAPYRVADGIFDGKRYPCWNPVLYQVPDGELMVFYKVGPDPETWWGMLKRSYDGGESWSDAEKLPDGILGPVKNKPVLLDNGVLLCASSTEHEGWKVHMEKTPDFGRTWESVIPVDQSSIYEVIQPAVISPGDGWIQLLCRSKDGAVITAYSKDRGESWSTLAATDLPNPNSGIDAVTLNDGRILLVYNHSYKPKGKWGGPRFPLNVAISENGQLWQASVELEVEPGEYSYPSVIQGSDGKVHIVYTWRREKIRHVVLDPIHLPAGPLEKWDLKD